MKESQRRQWQKVGEGSKSGVVKSDKAMRPSKPIAAICQLTIAPPLSPTRRNEQSNNTNKTTLYYDTQTIQWNKSMVH